MKLAPLFSEKLPDKEPLIIAGPCSAESLRQTMQTAEGVAAAGVRVFRAGVWKPRTKPGGFAGAGEPALEWLAKVRRATGLITATEVANALHTKLAVESGITVLWIGARTSANPFAVQEIADTLARLPEEKRRELTLLVKNPVNPDLELWIGALQRINDAGISRLGAIHRGFSSYGPHLYRNSPEWRIPIELRRRLPGLPLICDPSHISGRRELIPALAQQAMYMRFDGLMLECHCRPDEALSDSRQQITPSELISLLHSLVLPSGDIHIAESLEEMRARIDRIDNELLELLAERMSVIRDIGRYKREHNIPVLQPQRYDDLMQRCTDAALRLDLNPEYVKNILATMHEESVRNQIDPK